MAALTNVCKLYSIPGFNFKYINDFSIDKKYCKYYPCWDGKVLFISLVSSNCRIIKEKYQEAILKHNDSLENNEYPDSGFDVLVPDNPNKSSQKSTFKIDFNIKCAMFNKLRCVKNCNTTGDNVYDTMGPLGFYMYPRSSISKTHLRLANNVGIIDSGYRGNLGGFFDIHNLPVDEKPYEQYQRLVQICSNTLEPFKVILVDDVMDLGTTERGEGGFGSTGV
jgi:dUTP pyrophosphatase